MAAHRTPIHPLRAPRIARASLALAALLALAATANAEELDGRQIMERAKKANESDTQISEIDMRLIDKQDKEQSRAVKIWAVQTEGNSRTLTRFTEPKSVAGVGFLVLGEGSDATRFLYLPRMRKTRMIAEGDKDKPFMGTDFTYYDLSPHDLDGSHYEPVEEGSVDGIACYKVATRPKDLDNSLYSRVVQWVRKDNYVPIAADFFDKSGDLLKKSKVIDLKNIDGNWTPMKMEMHNVQIDHRTIMTVEKVEFDVDIPDRYFEKSHLERGR